MKNILAACLVTLALALSASANLEYITTERSVKESDFIVIGTLKSVSEIYNEDGIGTGDGEGILVVDKIMAGDVLTGDKLPLQTGDQVQLKWSEGMPCLDGWHRRSENEKGIWLLKIDAEGMIATGHPAQFATLDELPEIEKYIEKYSNRFSKTVSIQNRVSRNSDAASKNETIMKPHVPAQSSFTGKADYYPRRALLFLLFAGSLYWLLYRSGFKIR